MPFSPTDLTNLWAWYKADAGVQVITETPKARLDWDASGGIGSAAATACGAGNVDCIIDTDTLGSFTATGSETDLQFVTAVFNAIKDNSQGYKVALVGTVLSVLAKIGGSSFNGQSLSFSGTSGGSGTTTMSGGSDTSAPSVWLSSWQDQSGNGRHLTAQSGYEAEVATGVINSLPVVRKSIFNGADIRTSVNFADITSSGLTVYAVMKKKSTGVNGGILVAAGGVRNFIIRKGTFANTLDMAANTNSTGFLGGVNDDTFYSIRLRTDNNTEYFSKNNGTESTYSNTPQTYLGAIVSMFALSGANFGDFEIAEVIIYTHNVTGNNSDNVEYYLQQKYNHFTWSGSIPTDPTIPTTMATNEIQGDVVGLWISTDSGTTYTEVVCAENTGVEGTRDVNTKRTKCGVIKGFGPPAWQITGSGAINTTPGTGKVSGQALIAALENETPLTVKIAHASDATIYYRSGSGQCTRYSETANTGDAVAFDFTIDISGGLTIVSPS